MTKSLPGDDPKRGTFDNPVRFCLSIPLRCRPRRLKAEIQFPLARTSARLYARAKPISSRGHEENSYCSRRQAL